MDPQIDTTPLLSPAPTESSFMTTTSELQNPGPTSTDLAFISDSDPVYVMAVEVTNSISAAACLLVIISYIVLRWQRPRFMSRTSLKLSFAMACTDLIYHCANLAGFGRLPDGFVCAFVGGWLFAFGSMLSLFYASAIALNTQLVFVHRRTPLDNKQIYFLTVPLAVALLICTPALAAGVYGYDQTFEYCWYETRGFDKRTIVLRMIFTYNLWLCITLLYLVVAAVLIIRSIFNTHGPLSVYPTRVEHNQRSPSHIQSNNTTNAGAALAATMARRDMARRALTLRLLGYILVPTICIISGILLDLLGESTNISATATNIVSALAGLMGTLNAILFSFDPSVLAVVHTLRLQRARAMRRHRQAAAKPEGLGARCKAHVFGSELTVVAANTEAMDTNDAPVSTTVDLDTHLEAGSCHSFAVADDGNYLPEPRYPRMANGSRSTIGSHVEEVLETYHGL